MANEQIKDTAKQQRQKNKHDLESAYAANRVASIIIIILAAVAVIIIACWVWFTKINKPPTTTSTAQISTIGADNNKTYFMEFNQLRNINNNGTPLNELKFNYYTSPEKTTRYSNGIQSYNLSPQFDGVEVGSNGWWIFRLEAYFHHIIKSPFIYLNEDANDHSFKATNQLDNATFFIIEINNEMYKINFADAKLYKERDVLWTDYYFKANPITLFKTLYESASSLKTGDYVVNLDLSKFFVISKYDNNQWVNMSIADENSFFVECKVHVENRGAVNAKQSIFNNIAGNADYNTSNIEEKEYWKVTPTVTLTNENFNNREGYISLKTNLLSYANQYSNLALEISINLDNTNIKGFDYFGLLGLKFKKIYLTSSTQKHFELLMGSLDNTGLTLDSFELKNVVLKEVDYE